jgi:hypothetical protein
LGLLRADRRDFNRKQGREKSVIYAELSSQLERFLDVHGLLPRASRGRNGTGVILREQSTKDGRLRLQVILNMILDKGDASAQAQRGRIRSAGRSLALRLVGIRHGLLVALMCDYVCAHTTWDNSRRAHRSIGLRLLSADHGLTLTMMNA